MPHRLVSPLVVTLVHRCTSWWTVPCTAPPPPPRRCCWWASQSCDQAFASAPLPSARALGVGGLYCSQRLIVCDPCSKTCQDVHPQRTHLITYGNPPVFCPPHAEFFNSPFPSIAPTACELPLRIKNLHNVPQSLSKQAKSKGGGPVNPPPEHHLALAIVPKNWGGWDQGSLGLIFLE